MSEIIPGLILGGLSDARRAIRNGQHASFLCLLPLEDAKSEAGLPQLFSSEGPCWPFLFQDIRDEAQHAGKMRTALPECVDFIEKEIAQGRTVIVFCKWGQSRSATVVIGHLMLRHGFSLRRAFWLVRGHRNNAFPNIGFFQMLQDLDKELFGRVSMEESRCEYLAINLNKQVVPINPGIIAMSRVIARLQGKCQGRPKNPGKGELQAARGIWEVFDGIFVSDEVTASDEISVRAKRINRMLSLAPEHQARPDWADASIQYLGVSINDDPQKAKKSLGDWQRCHDFLYAGGKQARTLIFCNEGYSRSSTIVISYLLIFEGYTLHHAYWSIRQRLNTCCPDVDFFEELKKIEQRLRNGRCSMPVTREEYLKLLNQESHKPTVHERLAKWCEAGACKLPCCGRLMASDAHLCDIRLYGPLGLNLAGRLSLGDLCTANGFAEVPTHRCLLVAGHPEYYEDQSKETGLDVYKVTFLTPVPPDNVHQIRVAQRMVLVVINPNNLGIYLADDQDPQNEEKWLKLEIHCSPFRDKDINNDLMKSVIQDVERAPCSQAGQAHGHHVNWKRRNRLVWTSLQDFRERWQEMLESPVDAPIRVWHRYLWEYWRQAGAASSSKKTEEPDSFLWQEIMRVMPLGENSTYDDVGGFLRSKECHWSRLDLRHAETRYTKHKSVREGTTNPGEVADLDKFASGVVSALVDKNFCVGCLRVDFVSALGKGRHAVAYRAVIKNQGDVPVWLEDLEVCVKVWHRPGDHNTFTQEVATMQRLPSAVQYRTRFITSGRLRIPSGLLDFNRLTSHEHPDAIVTTLATGLPLSKALNSRTAGPEGCLAHCEVALWSVVRQILEFSKAMEADQSYHGDMTLDNALWDSSTEEITFIDFGNAGQTAQDPWKRTQMTGTMHLLEAIRERLQDDPAVPSDPSSCLAWLKGLKGEVSATSTKVKFGAMPRLPTRVYAGRLTKASQSPKVKLSRVSTFFSRMGSFENNSGSPFQTYAHPKPRIQSVEMLYQDFDDAAPAGTEHEEPSPSIMARAKSFTSTSDNINLQASIDSLPLRASCLEEKTEK